MTPLAMSVQNDVSGFVLNHLSNLPDESQNQAVLQFNNIKKKPGTAVVLAIFGFQYIYLQKWGLFVLYLITFGGVGLWWLIGIFTAAGAAKKMNDEKLAQIISYQKQNLPKSNPVPTSTTAPQRQPPANFPSISVDTAISEFDSTYAGKRSKNIFAGNLIQPNEIERAKKKYAHTLSPDEKPLLLLNKKSMFSGQGTGILFTDKQIYVGTLKDSFGASMAFKCNPNILQYSQVKSLQIGEHDGAMGTAYIGHHLLLNGTALGLVRMGSDMTYDDNAIDYLNSLFSTLKEKGIFTN